MKHLPMSLRVEFGALPLLKSPATRQGHCGPLVVMLVAFASRLWQLGAIGTLVFDETYHVKGAYGPTKRGYEVQWPKEYDDILISGHLALPTEGTFVMHPSAGKWLIGLGIELLGNNPWGWRLAVCLAGSICVFLVGYIVWYLFGNGKTATLASMLMALDGAQIALSHTAILDILSELFILLGVVFLVRDQLSYRPKPLTALLRADETHRTLGLWAKRPDLWLIPHEIALIQTANPMASSQPEKVLATANPARYRSLAVAIPQETKKTWFFLPLPRPFGKSPRGTEKTQRKGSLLGPVFWRRPWLFAAGIA